MGIGKIIKQYFTDMLNWLARKANSKSLKIATLAGAATVVGGATFNVIKALNDDAEPEVGNWALVLTGASYFLFTYLTGLMTNIATYQEMQNKVHELEIDKNVLPNSLVLTTFEALQVLSIGSISIFPWVAAGKGFDKKQSAATASQVISLAIATLLRVSERFWFDNATKSTREAIQEAEQKVHAIIQLDRLASFTREYNAAESRLTEEHRQVFKSGLIQYWIYFGLTFNEFSHLGADVVSLIQSEKLTRLITIGVLLKDQALQLSEFQKRILIDESIFAWLLRLDKNIRSKVFAKIIGSSESYNTFEILSNGENRTLIASNVRQIDFLVHEVAVANMGEVVLDEREENAASTVRPN